MIAPHCQRQTERRLSRRPAGETIRTADYDVEPIAEDAIARAFVETHHYAGTASSTAHRFGIYRCGVLVGVALFGPPASMNAHRLVWPTLEPDEAVTLGRLVLTDEAEANAESYGVARCLELLAKPAIYRPLDKHGAPRRPIVGVESCADPVVRADVDGRLVAPGHVGTIYQALNGRFIGRTRREIHRLLPDGTVFSRRAMTKIRGAERGWLRATATLVRFGAEQIDDSADRAERIAWLARWTAQITRPLVHAGCLRYVWCLSKRRRREVLTAPALPYLKIDALRAAASAA